ncbi:hypothetical protein A2715_00760 [Candidatus Woesebacteria bacterium RIFCSPHIGHO2_01_FULL_39_32]|uniref:Methylated-DNA-[protein]-cysteine S-methyltransferase DNA binding domain-containing protein n=1 Tax=Candidatus Woesebacteria bacterium RIFCSPLOWO2_01_FULL_39_25 TaxID=1802521 RepID=A0A1F8BI70_9BACT|nr:MAG: hypothetical protein A2124_03560 [Candidatus Woesebacteria bacterium GWB1_37_5]OGM24445.1 MAG: hypothetical protein A2715_00760 [Candidatus Woesebacteria bacterium RIFCSPHIGHO2_01_FULL_39_32]OGM35550.1 MAG: hypothetical protein A3F01_02510 [Candidatus Woesebacteria bacterium RIFCSPHIGHO2_12_FULL_38_11]OGM63751.1 MAG: hypothetical protein A2893_02095 [Candidatus Woesebacteria bacterium RIFCSPLOWO2_01_FULL_39_25]
MSKFKDGVIKVVSKVPYGKVVSYGQVALYIGIPRAARQVGWTLNRMEGVENVPWWRVINNQGRISIKGSKYTAQDQRKLLIEEGVKVNDDLTLDIEKYRFVPNQNSLEKLGMDSIYLEMISTKIPYSKYFPKGRLAKLTKKVQK